MLNSNNKDNKIIHLDHGTSNDYKPICFANFLVSSWAYLWYNHIKKLSKYYAKMVKLNDWNNENENKNKREKEEEIKTFINILIVFLSIYLST